ncbi:MAG: PspC domain-containing protein [Sphingobium sp.]|nr:PspC domain-containing protein [Sphingobium sp.]
MQFIRNSIFTRSDTMFGICQALGEDLGISPTWFRIAVAASMIYSIQAAFIFYAGLGVLALVSRLVYPSRRAASVANEAAPVATEAATVEAPMAAVMAEAA